MSGKKKPAGKQIALCLLLTAAVDGLGVLLVTLLAALLCGKVRKRSNKRLV